MARRALSEEELLRDPRVREIRKRLGLPVGQARLLERDRRAAELERDRRAAELERDREQRRNAPAPRPAVQLEPSECSGCGKTALLKAGRCGACFWGGIRLVSQHEGKPVGWVEDQAERAKRGEPLEPPPGRDAWKDERSEQLVRQALEREEPKVEKTTEKARPIRKPCAWRPGLSAEDLRTWRGERNWSAAGRALGVVGSTVKRWEEGEGAPSQRVQDKLAELIAGPAPQAATAPGPDRDQTPVVVAPAPPPASSGGGIDWLSAIARGVRRVADELERISREGRSA